MLWDYPSIKCEIACAESLALLELRDSALLTPADTVFARNSPIAAAGVDQPATVGSVKEVWALTFKGSLDTSCRRVPIPFGAKCSGQGNALKGLVATRWTSRDVDACPTLHALHQALRLRG